MKRTLAAAAPATEVPTRTPERPFEAHSPSLEQRQVEALEAIARGIDGLIEGLEPLVAPVRRSPKKPAEKPSTGTKVDPEQMVGEAHNGLPAPTTMLTTGHLTILPADETDPALEEPEFSEAE